MKIELRGKCPKCKNIRVMLHYFIKPPVFATLKEIKNRLNTLASLHVHCISCNELEEAACFIDDKQVETWHSAKIYELQK